MVTLKDIAQHVGISVSATSMALRDHASIGTETKQRVREAKKRLGYRARSRPTGNIAFVLFDREFDLVFDARFFQCISELALRRNRQPFFLTLERAAFLAGTFPPVLQKRGVDGIIVSGVYDEAIHRKFHDAEIPVVVLGNYEVGDEPAASCEVDIVGGIALIVRSLAELGHRRIGLLLKTPPTSAYGKQIREAFGMALARYGLESGGVVREAPASIPEEAAISEGFYTLMQSPSRPTAIISEEVTLATYDSCAALGLSIPGDVSVVSLTRSPEWLRPTPVMLESDPEEWLRGAYEKLERLIEAPHSALTREIFPMRLAPGNSIGPARSLN